MKGPEEKKPTDGEPKEVLCSVTEIECTLLGSLLFLKELDLSGAILYGFGGAMPQLRRRGGGGHDCKSRTDPGPPPE